MTETIESLKAGPIVERQCYTDADVFNEERKRIFERSWLFVAHESELKQPGDFRTADLAGQPVLAIRGEDGSIRVFFNTCRHRGAIVETESTGSRKQFRCLYHHWEYGCDGKLTFVPREDGFGPDFKRSNFPLVQVPKVETFHGLVFANLSPEPASLIDYIGTAAPFVEELATYNGRSLETVGTFEFNYDGNWKLLYENTFDDYHNEYLHARVYRNVPGLQYGTNFMNERKGKAAALAGGKPTSETHAPTKLGFHSMLHWHDSVDKMTLQKERTHHVNIGIFPSCLVIYHPVLDFTSLRILKPESVGRTRVLNYCLAPSDLSEEGKKAVAARFGGAYGPGGPIMMDDLRTFSLLQQGLQAKTGGDVIHLRGLHRGGTSGIDADDHAIRNFWDTWRHYMFVNGVGRPS